MTTARSASTPIILVADDSLDIRDVLSDLLEDAGYDSVKAVDGQDALNHALAHPVDLILLDLTMPRLTGEVFCRAYHDRGGEAPIILMTGSYMPDTAATIKACGAVGYIAKPFEVEQLLDLVERHVSKPPESAS